MVKPTVPYWTTERLHEHFRQKYPELYASITPADIKSASIKPKPASKKSGINVKDLNELVDYILDKNSDLYSSVQDNILQNLVFEMGNPSTEKQEAKLLDKASKLAYKETSRLFKQIVKDFAKSEKIPMTKLIEYVKDGSVANNLMNFVKQNI